MPPCCFLQDKKIVARGRVCPAALLFAAVLLCGCGGPSSNSTGAQSPDEELPVIAPEILTIAPQSWPTVVRTQGSLLPDELSVVGAKVTGRVDKVHVDLGDMVTAGDPLVTLDQQEFQLLVDQADAQLAQARSAVGLKPGDPVERLDRENAPPVRQEKALWDEAQAILERSRQLRNQNAITMADLEQIAAAERVAEARYQSALNAVDEKIALIGVRAAELSRARQNLQEAVVHAPFDGLVEQRHVAPGTYVQLGVPIVTLVSTNPLRFRGTIPERHAQQLATGQQLTLYIESISEPRTVTVTRISPALNELNRALMFEASVDNADGTLRPGLFGEAELVLDPTSRAIVVPASAIVVFAGAEKVWKVVDGILKEVVVETGRRRDDRVEILHGLAAEDRILIDGSEGQVARVQSQPAKGPAEEVPGKDATIGVPSLPAASTGRFKAGDSSTQLE